MTLNSNTVKADSEGNHKLGSALREHRKAVNLSLKDVAEKAGLSVGFISQVERDIVSPSLSSLASIAKTLETDISHFFSQPHDDSIYTRNRKRAQYSLNHKGLSYERLSTSFPGSVINSVIMHELPGHKSESIQHEGEEFFYILDGSLNIIIEGEETELETGDSIHFDSSREHSAWNHTDKTTTILHVCTMDVFGDKQALKKIPGINVGHKGV